MSHEPTRVSLLVRLRDPRDGEAWERFVRIYLPPVYRLARRYGLQDADAADAAQAVLTAVHQKIGSFDYEPRRGSFRGWLKTVARSRICDLLDARQRAPTAIGGSQSELPLDRPAPDESDEEWERDYRQGLFNAAAEVVRQEVQDRTFQAFWKTAVEGESAPQVAPQLGLSVGAVYIARSRVTARIREIIAAWEQEEPEYVD